MEKRKKTNFFNKNKNTLIAILVFIVVLLLFFCIYKAIKPEEKSAIYGNRLEGLESTPVSNADKKKIEKKLNEYGKKITIRIQGKIINIGITLNDEVNRDTAKTLGDKILETLSKKQIENYDIQIFVSKSTKAEDKAQFPIIGYKQISNEKFSWTKDR